MRCARRQSSHSKDQCPLFTPQADIAPQHSHVRFGSLADMCAAKSHVCFTPESGHVRCTYRCPLWARSGHWLAYSITHGAARALVANALQKALLLMEKRPHCRFNASAFGALVGVQFVAGVFGFNPKKPHPRLALWTVADSGSCGG